MLLENAVEQHLGFLARRTPRFHCSRIVLSVVSLQALDLGFENFSGFFFI